MSHVKKIDSSSAIIDNLEDLRNRHRLALHVWERTERFVFPKFSYDWISHVDAENIPEHLKDNTMPLMSMSLLPSLDKAIKPYEIKKNKLPMLGYLVDLDQDQPHPPKILKATPLNSNSGFNPLGKKLKLYVPAGTEALYKIYNKFNSKTEQQWRDAVADERDVKYTAQQLDALGAYAHSKTVNTVNVNNILPHNEILVAAAKEHIRAIVAPLYVSDDISETDKGEYTALLKLSGALAGLEHIKKGIDIPVVYYHVSPPGPDETFKQGTFSYLGKGKAELMEKGIEAIKELNAMCLFQANSFKCLTPSRFENLEFSVYRLMGGLDIDAPLSKQMAKLKKLEQEYKSGAARGSAL